MKIQEQEGIPNKKNSTYPRTNEKSRRASGRNLSRIKGRTNSRNSSNYKRSRAALALLSWCGVRALALPNLQYLFSLLSSSSSSSPRRLFRTGAAFHFLLLPPPLFSYFYILRWAHWAVYCHRELSSSSEASRLMLLYIVRSGFEQSSTQVARSRIPVDCPNVSSEVRFARKIQVAAWNATDRSCGLFGC